MPLWIVGNIGLLAVLGAVNARFSPTPVEISQSLSDQAAIAGAA
jgi:GAF domain-containing protein